MLGVHAKVFSGYQTNRKRRSSISSKHFRRSMSATSRQSEGCLSAPPLSREISLVKQSVSTDSSVPKDISMISAGANAVPLSEGKGAIDTTYKVFQEIAKDMKLNKVEGEPVEFEPSSKTTEQIDYVFYLVEVRHFCPKSTKVLYSTHWIMLTIVRQRTESIFTKLFQATWNICLSELIIIGSGYCFCILIT